jgi:hypothetical protein
MYLKAFGRPIIMGDGVSTSIKSKGLLVSLAKKTVNYKST